MYKDTALRTDSGIVQEAGSPGSYDRSSSKVKKLAVPNRTNTALPVTIKYPLRGLSWSLDAMISLLRVLFKGLQKCPL